MAISTKQNKLKVPAYIILTTRKFDLSKSQDSSTDETIHNLAQGIQNYTDDFCSHILSDL